MPHHTEQATGADLEEQMRLLLLSLRVERFTPLPPPLRPDLRPATPREIEIAGREAENAPSLRLIRSRKAGAA